MKDPQPVPASAKSGRLQYLPIAAIQPNPQQPRQEIHPQALQELAASLQAQGILQPLVVTSLPATSDTAQKYQLIAGERRWRAAQYLGWQSVPVLIREAQQDQILALALIENIQREALNPVEEAQALKRLQEEYQYSQQQIADAIGRSRSTVANLLRLLKLPRPVLEWLTIGALDQGHARALLALPKEQQIAGAREVIDKSLSVRQTEALVKRWLQQLPQPKTHVQDQDLLQLQAHLSEYLGTPVDIKHTKQGQGRLVIHYASLHMLDHILKCLR
ncbi:chromosome partitioning protein, ParB family [Allopseudospirillum japonicum]|uniref:Probable chromosome-partitioning protein ParB n=2 Tax=Allopseudospirillum japonicum TaxID=64971 RepID=A0A1H6R8W7_9GAMM|nr:ParB/RepB/Spo0J family partition protein [Allopseudospirillum japonicum]SEI52271.1 chromosome partitioning protein, ParB family [Allopseudospirillum japonicum]